MPEHLVPWYVDALDQRQRPALAVGICEGSDS
jgi:hypothetical protein